MGEQHSSRSSSSSGSEATPIRQTLTREQTAQEFPLQQRTTCPQSQFKSISLVALTPLTEPMLTQSLKMTFARLFLYILKLIPLYCSAQSEWTGQADQMHQVGCSAFNSQLLSLPIGICAAASLGISAVLRLTGCRNGGVVTFRHIYSLVSYQRLYYHYYRISHQLIVKYINILWVVQYYCGGGGAKPFSF